MDSSVMAGRARRALAGRRVRKGKARANCPFCLDKIGKADDRLSLVFFADTKRVACYRCKTWLFLRKDGEAYVERDESSDNEPRPIAIPKGCYPMTHPDVRDSLSGGPGYRYLVEERGVPIEVAAAAQIHVGVLGTLAGCVVVPILADDNKTWLGYVARAWNFKAYRNATAMTRGRFFNHTALFVKTEVPLLVVEGCYDALPTWPNSVACLGKPGDHHLELLARCERPVVMALDADAEAEGWSAAMRLIMRRDALVRAGDVAKRHVVACVAFPPAQDPGDFSGAETMSAARRALATSRGVGIGDLFPKWPGPGFRFDCVLPPSAEYVQAQQRTLEKTL